MDLVNIMKALSDETRLRILNLINKGELCVCELEHLLEINQSNASRHLNRLSASGLVESRKSSLYVYYKISGIAIEKHPFLRLFLNVETAKISKCRADVERLAHYRLSGLNCEELKDGKLCTEESREEENE